MEYKVFEKIFKDAEFTERQMKKIREECYKNYADAHGKKIATGGQKRMTYGFFIDFIRDMELQELKDYMWRICRATAEQSESLYKLVDDCN